MNKVLMYSGLFFLFVLGTIFGTAESVQAFTISPLRYSFVVDPGKKATAEIEVWNNEAYTIEVVPEIDAFRLDPETGHAQFGESDIAKSWVQTNVSSVLLVPGEKKRISFTITVPPGSQPESHYLGFFLKQKSSEAQIGIGKRIGTLVFLHVSGQVEEKMRLLDFSTIKKEQKKFFRIQTVNEGTIHLVPQGTVRLFNWRGKKIDEVTVNPTEMKVLPGGTLHLEREIPKQKWSHVGIIRADLVMPFGLTEQVLTQRIYFWYMPWWFWGSIFVMVIVVAGGIFVFKRKV